MAKNLDEFEGLLGLPAQNPLSHSLSEAARARLNVHKVVYSSAKPATSAVICPTGDITQDVNWYLQQSDQTPGHVHIETQWSDAAPAAHEGGLSHPPAPVQAAFVGGVFVQLLAEGDKSVLERVTQALRSGEVSLWQLQLEQKPLPEVAATLLPELGLITNDEGKHFFKSAGAVHPQRAPPTSAPLAQAVLSAQEEIAAEGGGGLLGPEGSVPAQQIPVDFFCRCSKDGFLQQLTRLPAAELSSMQSESPPPTLTCQFCNTDYPLLPADLDALLQPPAQTAAATPQEVDAHEAR